MSAADKVTIITTVHDRTCFLEESLRSSLGKAIDLIVVSDGVRVEEFVHSIDLNIIYLHVKPCLLGEARNRAVELVRTPYFIIVDDDDRLVEIPEETVSILDADQDVGVSYGKYQRFGLMGGTMTPFPNITFNGLLKGNLLFQSSLVRKKAWQDVGGYREDCQVAEDWDFWLKVAKSGWEFRYVPKVFLDYRIHERSGWSVMDPHKKACGLREIVERAR